IRKMLSPSKRRVGVKCGETIRTQSAVLNEGRIAAKEHRERQKLIDWLAVGRCGSRAKNQDLSSKWLLLGLAARDPRALQGQRGPWERWRRRGTNRGFFCVPCALLRLFFFDVRRLPFS